VYSQSADSLEIKRAICFKRSPGEAVFCGLILPGGAALYNNKKREFIGHVAFQAAIPAALCVAAASEKKESLYYVALSSFVASKLWDMYKGLRDAKTYNTKLFYNTD
jgi:hypothetical protein